MNCLPIFTSGRARLLDHQKMVSQFAALFDDGIHIFTRALNRESGRDAVYEISSGRKNISKSGINLFNSSTCARWFKHLDAASTPRVSTPHRFRYPGLASFAGGASLQIRSRQARKYARPA